MFADNTPVLAQLDALGISADLDRPANRARRDRVPVVVVAHEAGFGDRCRYGVEPVEAARIGNEARSLRFEDFPDRPVAQLGMTMRLGIGDALIQEPGV